MGIHLSRIRTLRSILMVGLLLAPGGFLPAQLESPGGRTGGNQSIVGVVRLVEMGTNEVLDMLQNYTGKPILRQQNLPAVRITFNSQGPLTRDEAILAIESLLALNGVAITDVGDRFLKAVPAATASTQVPQLLLEPALSFSPSQKIYAKFFRLDFLSVEEAVAIVQPLMTQGAPQAFEKSKAILLTDSLINLQRIESVLERVDQPSEVDVDVLFFQLRHIAASEAASRLETLQQSSLKRFLDGNTTIDGDDRSNQLLVFTHPSNEKLISDLIARLDVDIAPITKTEIYHIKHADAEDITQLIDEIITGQQRARDEATSRSGSRRSGQPAQQSGNQQAQSGPVSGGADGTASSLQFSDYIRIVADARSNAIVASGTPNDLAFLDDLIAKIDVLLAQVRIEVVIAEVTLTQDQLRGIDSFGIDFNTEGAGVSEIAYDVNSAGTSRLPNGFSFSGSVKDFSISAIIDTAKRKSNVRVLSTPTIVTTHNREASITVGESRPVITATQSDSSVTSTIRSNVQFRDIGIELTVTPLIGSNGIIQMEIDQIVENVVGSVEIDNNEQPIIGRRQATSFIGVNDGDLIVLGGLQETNTTKGRGKLAILGDIPLLGGLFGSRTIEETKRELIIFIRPEILATAADASEDANRTLRNLQLREEVERFIEEGNVEMEFTRQSGILNIL